MSFMFAFHMKDNIQSDHLQHGGGAVGRQCDAMFQTAQLTDVCNITFAHQPDTVVASLVNLIQVFFNTLT